VSPTRHPARGKLAYALDFPSFGQAEAGAAQVASAVGVLKVGLELFVSEGPRTVALGEKLGCEVFLDLKPKRSSAPSPPPPDWASVT